MKGLTPQETEKCKEIELKNQEEYLTGGYQKLMLKFYEKMCRANEMVDRLADGSDRLKQKIDILEDELCGKREEIHTLEEEIKGLREDLEEEMDESREKDMLIEELKETLKDREEEHWGKYAKRQLELGPVMPDLKMIGESISIQTTAKPIQSITIRLQNDEEEW